MDTFFKATRGRQQLSTAEGSHIARIRKNGVNRKKNEHFQLLGAKAGLFQGCGAIYILPRAWTNKQLYLFKVG